MQGQYVDAATVFLRISSPPVFLAPDAMTLAVAFSTWMHHRVVTAGSTAGHRSPPAPQDKFAMTSMICRTAAAHADSVLDASQLLLEELAAAGCLHAMHAVTAAQQQYLAGAARVPATQNITGMLATMLQGGVGEYAGICIGGIVRRATDAVLRLGGAPLPQEEVHARDSGASSAAAQR
jgi:hypothetical protein